VQQRLDDVEWDTQRTLIRTLVKQVTIDREEVHIVFRIHPEALPAPPTDPSLHYCWGRGISVTCQHRPARDGNGDPIGLSGS
jgi:hypothetical protein